MDSAYEEIKGERDGKTRLQGRYEIGEKIGEGGMARVYRGWDNHIGQKVAIKVLKRKEKEAQEAFRREAARMKGLHHPGIPILYDFWQEEGKWYLVMEYLEGISLEQYLLKQGAMPQRQAFRGIWQLTQSLSCLHGQNPPLIYCDMKPANILMTPEGHWKLLDFGAAREKGYDRSRWEKNAGTYGFAAPEQTGQEGVGNRVDERSDIYALGKTWYHLLTGQNPAHVPYGSQPLSCYVPDLVEGTEQIIRKMTRPLPEERYQSTEELEQVLEKLEQSDGRWDGRNGKKGWKRGRKSFFIRRIEEQIWLAQAKQEYTFYQDSCIMKSSQSGRSGQAGIPGKE